MILNKGAKVLISHRRLYETDHGRYFTGMVDAYEDGIALREADRPAEALPLLREALTGMEAIGDERIIDDTQVREALERAQEAVGG